MSVESVDRGAEAGLLFGSLLPKSRGGVLLMSNQEKQKDYYSKLGASSDDSLEEIERRYKRLAQRHHPDRGGDEEEMKSINEAWRVLGNADARRTYDAGRARPREIYREIGRASCRERG